MEQKQIRTRIVLLAVATIFIVTAQGARAADECLEKPNAPSPQGSHWYYRTDRTTNRQCWYLGSERGKVGTASLARRQDTAPARPQSSKMSASPAQPLAQATAAQTATAEVMPEAPPVEITADHGSTPEATSPISGDRESTTSTQEMGLTGPRVISTERLAPVRALASSFSFTQFCAVLAVVLGLAAIIGRMIFTLVRRPMPSQSRAAQGQRSAASTDKHVLETFAHDPILATVGYQVDARETDRAPQTVADAVIAPEPISCTSTAGAHETGMADRADWVSPPPSDTVAGIESTLRHLLHELEQFRHERVRRAFEPTRKAAA
jgi:hypothetical protein